jgi:DNA-binding CsgD family transcriptional regulator
MPDSICLGSAKHDKILLSAAAVFAECTQPPEHCSEIPIFLGRILDLEFVTLAVTRHVLDDAAPCILLQHCSGPDTSAEFARLFQQCLLSYSRHDKSNPQEAADGCPTNFEEGMNPPYHKITVHPFADFPHALVFAQKMDASHNVLFIVHRRNEDEPLEPEVAGDIVMIVKELARQLHGMLISQNSPLSLGKPFDRLTNREWLVLCGLNSDASEKQIADQIGFSRHTLHAHIKSIYRKVGVQGRLPLLLRLNSAVHRLRMDNLMS